MKKISFKNNVTKLNEATFNEFQTNIDNAINSGSPIGSVTAYAGQTAPSGWLLCNGSKVSKSTYPKLYKVIGTLYGEETSTEFALPNLSGKIPVMQGGTAFKTIGSSVGEEKHTLTINEVPKNIMSSKVYDTSNTQNTSTDALSFQWSNKWRTGLSLQDNAGGQAHNIIQPSIVMNYIIKCDEEA